MDTIQTIINTLQLTPHPEGGFFRETFRDPLMTTNSSTTRNVCTAIYFLLRSQDVSRLHKIQSSEIWHFYAGDPLVVVEWQESLQQARGTTLGKDFVDEHVLQHIVPPRTWFGAYPQPGPNGYSLVGCTVAPGFDFDDFELASTEIEEKARKINNHHLNKILNPDYA